MRAPQRSRLFSFNSSTSMDDETGRGARLISHIGRGGMAMGTTHNIMARAAITAIIIGGQFTFLTAAQAADGFTHDTGKYVYLLATASTKDDIVNSACPVGTVPILNNLKIGELLSGDGDRSASLVLEIALPEASFPKVTLEVLKAEVDKSLFNSKCSFALHQINYVSPIFAMNRHSNKNFTVSLQTYKRKSLGGVFQNSIDEILGGLEKLALVPADSLTLIGNVGKVAKTLANVDSTVVDKRDLLISPLTNNKGIHTWNLKKFDRNVSSDIVISIKLMTKDNLFEPVSGQWSPANILQTSFYSPVANSTQNVEGFLLASAGPEYTAFANATDINVAQGACPSLFTKVDRMGLTARDTAILKWSLIRGHQNLGHDPKIDQLRCAEGIWSNLPATKASNNAAQVPDVFKPRNLVAPVTTRPASYAEMSSALEVGNAFALLFKHAAWQDRKPFAERLLARPHKWSDPDGIGVLRTTEARMEAGAEWLGHQWDLGRPLARNIGCYSYRGATDTDIGANQVLALGNFLTGEQGSEKEALVRVTFAAIPSDGSRPAQVDAVEVIGKPTGDQLTSIKLRHGSKCGGEWAPALLK